MAKNERYRTFNMGIGFVVILSKEAATQAESILKDAGETVYHIGHIHKRDGAEVTLVG